MHRNRMSLILFLLFFVSTVTSIIHPMRTAKAKMIPNSMYVAAYHLHAMGIFPTTSLHKCIYQCQNNDYCRTATYFVSQTGTFCSLFEESSSVGKIVSISSTVSTVIAFDLCPPGFSEPTHICFGVSAKIQPPVSVQQALNGLRLVQTFPSYTYHPIVVPSINTLYVPLYGQTVVQRFEWPSLKPIGNVVAPFPIYSYDMDASDNLLQSSSTTKRMSVSGPSGNWSDLSISYYAAFLSDAYVVVVPSSTPPVYILNSTTGNHLFNYTSSISGSLWARIINHQLYITSSTGLRRFSLAEGASATPILLVPNLACKELFFDASGRLYVEENSSPNNKSFVFDLNGLLIANYTRGSKMIARASKYSYFIFNNMPPSELLLYEYP